MGSGVGAGSEGWSRSSSVGRVESFPQPRQSLAEILTDAHRGGWNGKNIDVPIASFGIPCEFSGVVNCKQ